MSGVAGIFRPATGIWRFACRPVTIPFRKGIVTGLPANLQMPVAGRKMPATPDILRVDLELFALHHQIAPRPMLPAEAAIYGSPVTVPQPVGQALPILGHLVLR